ncbi:MAG: hypothetical protein CL489_16775 [Acidobacteria bacterium]|nr:hypothetical protein [Acidobacteriota bacterium]|tara:strand:+ start:1152 stop:2084 length:933 start_codon:yes stop_codon:yes gene_type:complete
MGKTHFSGPITVGKEQGTVGTLPTEKIRNVGFVLVGASFPFDAADITVADDADKIATAASNAIGTTTMTLVDATQNVPGLTTGGGYDAACVVTITSTDNDSPNTITVTGTDVAGNVETEDITGPNTTTVVGTVPFKTITSMVSDSASIGALSAGVILTGTVTIQARSKWNHYPLGQTVSSAPANLANNIVIPSYSRIHSFRIDTLQAFATAGLDVAIGSFINVGGTISNTLDLFAGDLVDNDIQPVGTYTPPIGIDQSEAQGKNCLNVSDDDTVELDKIVTLSFQTDDILTADGEATLYMSWLQRVNNVN